MKINFQQGIIAYPVSGAQQAFLFKTGVYVSLQTTNGRVDVNFANGESNYLHTEAGDVENAWGPIPVSTDTWLFWDIDSATAVRTFGITLLQPLYGNSLPSSATQGQHFFHTTQKKMYLYDSNAWRVVIRVFAAKVNNSTFTPLGTGFVTRPYAGSQVGLTPVEVVTGRILVDDTATPVRRPDGRFFTTEDRFFANGSPVTAISLEANALTATAQEYLSAYQVVYYSSFGKVNLATYEKLQQEVIAMLMENLSPNETGSVITQGTVTNPAWDFTTVGAKLWIDNSGVLVEVDPHVSDPLNYPIGKPAIGRVITPNTIFFDQGLGGIGEQGQPGPAATVDLATSTIVGVTKLSLAAVDPTNPIAVGDNDVRMSDARTPLSHNQAATTITFTPYGNLTAANVQLVLQQVETNKVNRSGDTLTGPLTLSGDPTSALHAATKQYVDAATLNGLSDVTLLSATSGDFLTFNGTVWTNTELVIDLSLGELNDVDIPTPNNGDVLSWTGTSWTAEAIDIAIPITATEIAFGSSDGTTIDSDQSLTYDAATGAFSLQPTLKTNPGDITISTATAAVNSNNVGTFNLYGGSSSGTGSGGSIQLYAGDSTEGHGGNIIIRGGHNGDGSGTGGNITLTAGDGNGFDGVGTNAGTITLQAGQSLGEDRGGDVVIRSGFSQSLTDSGGNITLETSSSDFGQTGYVELLTSRGVRINGSYGTPGDVLISDGDTDPPYWGAPTTQEPVIVTLVDGPTITPDFSTSTLFEVALAGNRLLDSPINQTPGQSGVITIQQTAGGNTLTYGSDWYFSSGTAPTLSTGAGAIDILAYYVISPNVIAARLIPNFQ